MGSSILVDKLRVMLSLELFLNASFYASHPLFEFVFNSKKNLFPKLRSVFFLSLSHRTSDLEETCQFSDIKLVQKEAIYMCKDKCWCSLLGVLSLSSVLKQKIQLNYPDFGPIKYRTLWNNLIIPRHLYENSDHTVCSNKESVINLLYCKIYG